MKKLAAFQIVLALFFIIFGFLGVWENSPFVITGRFVYNSSQSELQFISPTPSDSTIHNTQHFTINVQASDNISSVFLEIDGVNESMSLNNTWRYTSNATGEFSFIAYATSNNVTLSTERRSFKHGYVQVANISGFDIVEDTNSTLSLFPYITSNTPKQDLSYNLSFDNSNLQCNINDFNLSCMPGANLTGRTIITLKVSDGPISTSTDFTVNVTKVNDPPYIISEPSVSVPEHKRVKIDLSDNVADVESDPLTYYPINNSKVGGLYGWF